MKNITFSLHSPSRWILQPCSCCSVTRAMGRVGVVLAAGNGGRRRLAGVELAVAVPTSFFLSLQSLVLVEAPVVAPFFFAVFLSSLLSLTLETTKLTQTPPRSVPSPWGGITIGQDHRWLFPSPASSSSAHLGIIPIVVGAPNGWWYKKLVRAVRLEGDRRSPPLLPYETFSMSKFSHWGWAWRRGRRRGKLTAWMLASVRVRIKTWSIVLGLLTIGGGHVLHFFSELGLTWRSLGVRWGLLGYLFICIFG